MSRIELVNLAHLRTSFAEENLSENNLPLFIAKNKVLLVFNSQFSLVFIARMIFIGSRYMPIYGPDVIDR